MPQTSDQVIDSLLEHLSMTQPKRTMSALKKEIRQMTDKCIDEAASSVNQNARDWYQVVSDDYDGKRYSHDRWIICVHRLMGRVAFYVKPKASKGCWHEPHKLHLTFCQRWRVRRLFHKIEKFQKQFDSYLQCKNEYDLLSGMRND